MPAFVCLEGIPEWESMAGGCASAFQEKSKREGISVPAQHPQASGNHENILQCYLDTLAEVLKGVR